MPPSRAESVATVGAARTRTRARYVRHRYSVSRPPLSLFGLLLLLWYLTPPLSSRGSRYAHLPLPSLRQIAIPLFPSSPVRCSSRALRSLAPRPHRVYIPHSLHLYMCTYMQAYNAYTTLYHRHRPTSLLLATSVVVALPRKIKLELQQPAGQPRF